jgi:uncharacterized membrane protein
MARSHSPDLPRRATRGRHVSARTQVTVSLLVGALVAAAVALAVDAEFAPLAGWDATTIVYMAWVWMLIWPCDADQTARRAEHADPTRATADLLLLSAAVVSLAAVAGALASAAHSSGSGQVLRVTLGLASVVLSWGTVHTVYTLRYARLYYDGDDGGVDFKQHERPRFSDFAYLAFTVGTTFQVSDTDLQNEAFRRTVLKHCLLSFLFGTGILATTINLVAGLSSGN